MPLMDLGTSKSSVLISAFLGIPLDGASTMSPEPVPQEGALSRTRRRLAGVEAAQPERASSAHAQKPRCRFRGCRKARGQRQFRPRARASLPRRDPGLSGHPRPPSGLASRGRGADGHSGRDTLAREPGRLSSLQMKAQIGFPILLQEIKFRERGTVFTRTTSSLDILDSRSWGRSNYANIWGCPAPLPGTVLIHLESRTPSFT